MKGSYGRLMGVLANVHRFSLKLLLSYSIILTASILVMSLVPYNRIEQYLNDYSTRIIESNTKQMAVDLDSRFSLVDSVTNNLLYDIDVQKCFNKNYGNKIEEYESYILLQKKVSGILQWNNTIVSITFIHFNKTLSMDNDVFHYDGNIENHLQNDAEGWSIESIDGHSQICKYKVMYSFDSLNYIGLMRISVEKDYMDNLVKKLVFPGARYFILVDDKMNIVSHPDTLTSGQSSSIVESLPISDDSDSGFMLSPKKDEAYFYSTIFSSWRLICVMDYLSIYQPAITIQNYFLLIGLVCFLLVLFLSIISSRMLSGRLDMLIRKIRKIENGDLNLTISMKGKDEFAEIDKAFCNTIEQIRILFDELSASEKFNRLTSMDLLQEKINPHFLFNTLAIIKWEAISVGNSRITKIVSELSNFYRLSSNNGRIVCKIEDEINLIKSYVQIQSMRNNADISLVFDIQQDIRECSIIKMILQPFVENSVIHGFTSNEDIKRIAISARRMDDQIIISISDNGVGIATESGTSISGEVNLSDFRGYGIRNVNERMKLHYGDAYGVRIFSRPGEGTEVKLNIPLAVPDTPKAIEK
jgi:two-component system, sensor histidine kinase YesM